MIEDEEFSFIEEKFMESKKPRKEKVALMKKATLCGICFGLSAGVAFSVVQSVKTVAFKPHKTSERITLQVSEHPTTEPKAEKTEKNKNGKNQERNFGFDDMQKFYMQLDTLKEQCEKSIVGISDYSSESDKQQYNTQHQMTGTIIANTGTNFMILTNYNRLMSEKVIVHFFDGTYIEGKLYGKDTRTDLAIISVSLKKLDAKLKKQVKVVSFGDLNTLSVGSLVFALGGPNGEMHSVEYGYISGLKSKKSVEDYQLDVYTTSMGYHSDGNGIICDAHGQLLGVISRQDTSTENCTFYGIDTLRQLVEGILNKEKLSYVGITAEEIPEKILANHSVRGGIYVTAVAENSPAYKAGILVGDVISTVEGEEITSVLGFYNCIQKYEVGDKITVSILKNPFQNPTKKEKILKLKARDE